MRNLIRRWLGIDDIVTHLSYSHNQGLMTQTMLKHMDAKLDITNQGVGHLIAKIDPHMARSEHDPKVKSESDKIGEDVIARLRGEQLARQHTEGKL